MSGGRGAGGLLGRLRPKKPEPPRETGGEQRTLALAPLLDWLAHRRNARVVDLGAAHGENLTFFSRYGCRLEFLDLYEQLREVGQTSPGAEQERTRRLVERALDLGAPQASERGAQDPVATGASRQRESIDLVLFWDLVNYLTPPQIAGVNRAISPLLASGSRAFLLLSHSPQLPLHPRRLRIAGADRLVWEGDAAAPPRPCPQYSEHQLHKMFPDFTVERSFLMRHGVREYLLAIPETREQAAVVLP